MAWPDGNGGFHHHATVLRIEDNLCWIKPDSGEAAPFIWWFPRDNAFNSMATFTELQPELQLPIATIATIATESNA